VLTKERQKNPTTHSLRAFDSFTLLSGGCTDPKPDRIPEAPAHFLTGHLVFVAWVYKHEALAAEFTTVALIIAHAQYRLKMSSGELAAVEGGDMGDIGGDKGPGEGVKNGDKG